MRTFLWTEFGDPLSRKVLESLPVENYQKAIILADQKKGSSTHSATTTAMFIRHIQVLCTRNQITAETNKLVCMQYEASCNNIIHSSTTNQKLLILPHYFIIVSI